MTNSNGNKTYEELVMHNIKEEYQGDYTLIVWKDSTCEGLGSMFMESEFPNSIKNNPSSIFPGTVVAIYPGVNAGKKGEINAPTLAKFLKTHKEIDSVDKINKEILEDRE